MRPSGFWRAILPFSFVVASGSFAIGHAQAADGQTFIIAAMDGYGVEDCLADGAECGHVVADAWCEAHGHGPAR